MLYNQGASRLFLDRKWVCCRPQPKFTLLGRARRNLFPFCPSSYRVTVVLATRESDPSQQPSWRSTRMSSLVRPAFIFLPPSSFYAVKLPTYTYSLQLWSCHPCLSFLLTVWSSQGNVASFFYYLIISGDELFSDTYPMKLVDDCIYEVYGKVRLGWGAGEGRGSLRLLARVC